MSAVPNLVSNVLWFCVMYKTLCSLDSWVYSSEIISQKRVLRVKPGIQDGYSHRIDHLERTGLDRLKSVNELVD